MTCSRWFDGCRGARNRSESRVGSHCDSVPGPRVAHLTESWRGILSVAPRPNFDHLLSMTGPFGTFEHAEHAIARPEHGYCTDDVARVLLVVAREPGPEAPLLALGRTSLQFLEEAQGADGRFRNRRLVTGAWRGPTTSEDCWGRAMWALGTSFARGQDPLIRRESLELFNRGSSVRSRWARSTAFAVLGATEVLGVDPHHREAIRMLEDASNSMSRHWASDDWAWPEPRLAYANAVLPESMLAVGSFTGDGQLIETGLRRLRWLLDHETYEGHLSVTPAGGRGPGEQVRRFDQQPIEVAAMADACARAYEVTGEQSWLEGRDLAIQWFLGSNDIGTAMFDPLTGGGYDGLTATGPNLNQGAESTIAFLTTMQHARQLTRTSS